MEDLITIEGPGPLNTIGNHGIDWAKPVETMDGQKVHIYAIDHVLNMPVIGKVAGVEPFLCSWSYSGIFHQKGDRCHLDLRNIPEAK